MICVELSPCEKAEGAHSFTSCPDIVETEHPVIGPLDIRKRIFELEDRISGLDGAVFGDSELCPVKHSFSGDIYLREIFIPAGTVMTGKIHRHPHSSFLMKGSVTVVTEADGLQRLTAPMLIMAQAGTKRAGIAHEDTVWVTVHNVGKERDLEKITEMLFCKDYAQLESKGIA